MKTTKIVFYIFYKFCRILILVTLKMKITIDSVEFYLEKLNYHECHDE